MAPSRRSGSSMWSSLTRDRHACRMALRHGVRRSLDMKIGRSEGRRDSLIGRVPDRSGDLPAGYSSLGTWRRTLHAAPKNLWKPSCVGPYQSGQLTSAVMPFSRQ